MRRGHEEHPGTDPGGSGNGDRGNGDRGDLAIEAPGADEVGVVPWPLLLRRRLAGRVEASPRFPWVVLVTVLFGLFTVGFTITLLAVSIPSIAADLGSDTATLTWVITGPLLTFGVLGPAFGKAGDLWGQRRIFMIGMAGAALFAGLTALAWSAGSLIAFRVLGAAMGASAGPASMALIYSVFPRERRVQAMGWWSFVMTAGPVLGVVAGGPVVEHLSWRLIFAAQAPLSLAAVVVAALLLPETRRGTRARFDVLGTVTLAVAMTSLLLALNRGPLWGWSSAPVLTAFAVAPVFLVLFVVVERRVTQPLIRLEYFRRRNVAAPIATQFFTNFAYMGGFMITPLFLAQVFGYGETRIGLLSISRPLAFAIVAPVGGYLAMKIGERIAGVFGASAVAASMGVLALVGPGGTDGLVILGLALSGVGLGAASPSMAATIANSVDEDSLGVAGAMQQLITQVGVVAGIQLMQTIQASNVDGLGLLGSYHLAYALGGAVCLFGIVAAAFVRSTPRGERAGRRAPGETATSGEAPAGRTPPVRHQPAPAEGTGPAGRARAEPGRSRRRPRERRAPSPATR